MDTDIDLTEIANYDLYSFFFKNGKSDFNYDKLKKKYKKLVIKYHPDKKNGNVEKFEWIQLAYGVLSNNDLRKKYDDLYRLTKESSNNHTELKNQVDKYNLQQSFINDDDNKKKAKDEFDKKWKELDNKHNVITGNIKDIDTNYDINTQLHKLENTRNSLPKQDIIIEPSNFNINDFNKYFNKIKESNTSSDNSKINAITINNQFAGLNSFDNLYTNDNISSVFNNNTSSLDEAFNVMSVDVNKLDISNESSNYNNHNNITNDYNKKLNDKLEEYKKQTHQLQNLKINDFNHDLLGYGIFDKITTENQHFITE